MWVKACRACGAFRADYLLRSALQALALSMTPNQDDLNLFCLSC